MAKRRQIDWEAIEREVRAGQISLKEIARQNDCSDTAIRKKIKKEGWQRSLAKQVREKVHENLVRAEVRNPNANDKEIINQTAERGAQVVLLHRQDLRALRIVESNLIHELNANPTKLYITQFQGEIIERTIGLTVAEKAQAANNLANVQHKRMQLERQAFNIDEDGGTSENKPPVLHIHFTKVEVLNAQSEPS